MLKMIKMSKPKSCSVCCVAMLANITFDDAVKICFRHYPKDFSMDFDAMENALINAGLEIKRLEFTPDYIVKDTLIECRHKSKRYWHYVVYDAERKCFLDPIPNPPCIKEYEFFRSIEIKRR